MKTAPRLLFGAAMLAGLLTLGMFAQDPVKPPYHPPEATPGPPTTPRPVTIEEIKTIKEISAEQFQIEALKWIGAAGTVGTALLAMVTLLWGRYNDMRERLERQGARMQDQQKQITGIALNATPPPAPGMTSTTTTSTAATPPTAPTICALLGLCLALNGCALSYDPESKSTSVVAQMTWSDAIAISQAIAAAKRGNDGKAVKLLERATLPPPAVAPPATPKPKPRKKATPGLNTVLA